MAEPKTPRCGDRALSYILTAEDSAIIKSRIREGEFLNRIAADFDVNRGRISKIKTGKRFPKITARRLTVPTGRREKTRAF